MANENKIRILYVQPGKYPEERLVTNELPPFSGLSVGILHITVSSKSVDALADLYRFTQDQRDILHQLLSEEMRPSLLALCGGIAVADGELCWPLPGHTYPRCPQRHSAGQRLERQLRQSGTAG